MRLLNRGKNTITHAESDAPGSACNPGSVFSVSDALGAKLKRLYPKQLECLDDAKKIFAEPEEKVVKKKAAAAE